MTCLNRKFVSSSFDKIVNIVEKNSGSNLEISDSFEKQLKYNKTILKFYKDKVESRFSDYRQIKKDSFENYINKNIGNLPISGELKRVDKSDLLSSDYNSLYPSAMAHKESYWFKIETAIAIKKEDSACLCDLFNTGEWKKLNKSGFFDVKDYNPENIIFQHMSVREQVFNAIRNSWEEVNRFRNGYIKQDLTSIEIEKIVRVGVIKTSFFEGFIFDEIDYNPFEKLVLDMTAKRNKYKKRKKKHITNSS